MASAATIDAPSFAYGLDLNLNTESLGKLGIKELPKVGSEMKVRAVGVVTSASTNERTEGKLQRDITIQLQQLEVKGAKLTAEDAVDAAVKEV